MQEHEGRMRWLQQLLLHRLLRGRGSRIRAGRAIVASVKTEHGGSVAPLPAHLRVWTTRARTCASDHSRDALTDAEEAVYNSRCMHTSSAQRQQSFDSLPCMRILLSCWNDGLQKDWQGELLVVVGGMRFGGRSPELLDAGSCPTLAGGAGGGS